MADLEDSGSGASALLAALLAERPDALVAALSSEGRLIPPPASIPLGDQTVFDRRSGLDLVAAEDQGVIIEGWRRVQVEPFVRMELHLLADPERLSVLHMIDVRPEHGVHMLVLEVDDPAQVLEAVAALEARGSGVARVKRDGVGVFLEVDEGTTSLLGWSPGDLVGHGTIEFVHPDDVDRAVETWMSMRAGTGGRRTQVRFRHADGHYVWVEVSSEDHLAAPELACVVSEMVDISDQMADLQALHERERLLHRLAEALPTGICHLRADREVVYSNAPLVELLGPVDSVEALVGSVAPADRVLVEIAIGRALEGRPRDLEVGVVDGAEERRCELTFRALLSDSGGLDGVIVCATDVTERSRLRSELEHRASHDALSGCLNRAATVAALDQLLRDGTPVTVAFLDLDGFKAINDDIGHAAGDEVLRIVAERLRRAARSDDRIGRLGGDEFVVICPHGPGTPGTAEIGQRLTAAVCGEVAFARQRIQLQASIGVVASQPGERDAEAVLIRADGAMYEAKRLARRPDALEQTA